MGPCENNAPFGGYFAPPFAGMGRHPFGGSFRGGDTPDHYSHKPSFGPFGWHRFDRSSERHCRREPEHPRWGPPEQSHRGYSRHGPSECNCCRPHSRGFRQERGCHSPGTNRHQPWFGRSTDQHRCGRRDQSQCCESSCRQSCERPSQWSECGRHASCCDQRRQCHNNHCERHSRKTCCENRYEPEPCCGGNKEENEQNHDDNVNSKDDEPANERDNKIQMVILWLLRELFWKTIKGRQISDTNMEIIIMSTTALQKFLGWDLDK